MRMRRVWNGLRKAGGRLLPGRSDVPRGPPAPDRVHEHAIGGLLFLVQALGQVQGPDRPALLQVVSSCSQPAAPDDVIAYERTAILGLIKTIPQELPWLNCRHVDLTVDRVEMNAAHVLQEVQAAHKDR